MATATHVSLKPVQNGAEPYINSRIAGISGAFSDPRIFLAAPYDQRLASIGELDSEHCQVQQQDDGPAYLVIGPNVSDESLLRAGKCFGIPDADLVQFRNSQDAELLPIWRPVLEIATPDGGNTFEVVGNPVPKKDAWKAAEDAADKRGDVVSVIVRRELKP